jgi:hypothetical protein
MTASDIVLLEFDAVRDELGEGKELRDGLSVVLQIGNDLWLANDETESLERLSFVDQGKGGTRRVAQNHRQFALSEYLQLPALPTPDGAAVNEVDVEGLDHADGYLWLVGSHSLKRKAPKGGDGGKAVRKRLAGISADGNRYLLARIPLVEEAGRSSLARETSQKKQTRTAARLQGDHLGNELTSALRADEHLGPFLAIPGKENGFDIEGLAVRGNRVLLGLRGPVLRGWAVVVEIALEEDTQDRTLLRLRPFGEEKGLVRKHFLNLNGLGIRDLCRDGRDLLILAGPTMQLDGPVMVFRWKDGAEPDGECVLHDPELLMSLPFGIGEDHAEGIALLRRKGDDAPNLLVVYDSASVRRQPSTSTVIADVFKMPDSSGRASRKKA